MSGAIARSWERVFAAGYDRFMAGAERADLGRRRSALLAQASGRVLALGGGPGFTLAHYAPPATEPALGGRAEPMARRLEERAGGRGRVVRASAEALPFADDSF